MFAARFAVVLLVMLDLIVLRIRPFSAPSGPLAADEGGERAGDFGKPSVLRGLDIAFGLRFTTPSGVRNGTLFKIFILIPGRHCSKILTPTPGHTDTSTVDTNEQRHRSKQQGERGAATVADNKRERSALPTASTDGWRSRRGTVLAPLSDTPGGRPQ